MSTNGIIARSTGEGTFQGVYHHWDSYPTGLGKYLVELYRGHFRKAAGHAAFNRMLAVLIDEHPAGWSTVYGKDFRFKPGYGPEYKPEGVEWDDWIKTADYLRPKCYCHGKRNEKAESYDHTSDCGAEYAYVFEVVEGVNVMHILYSERIEGNIVWKDAGRVDLDDDTVTIDWTYIECGEKLERCQHYAHVHGLAPKTSNLSTQAYLGQQALTHRDAIGFVIDGKEYAATGSGGRGGYVGNLPRQRLGIFSESQERQTSRSTHSNHRRQRVQAIPWRRVDSTCNVERACFTAQVVPRYYCCN